MMKFTYPAAYDRYSLHNHSTFSDGASAIEEMCAAGKESGVQVFGISDHWCVPICDGTDWAEWCMAHDRLDEYVETLLKMKARYDDENFSVKIGLEVEYFAENIDSVLLDLKKYPIDYLIGSVHFTGTFSVDHDIADWEGLTQQEIDNICEIYWQKMESAAKCKDFAFLGHLDLPKKYNLIDNSKYFNHAVRVLDILQKSGGAIEFNTAGWFKNCKEQYPSDAILKEAAVRKIPVIINADAHHHSHITRSFQQAADLLKNIISAV